MNNNQLAEETLIGANNYVNKVCVGITGIANNFMAGREDIALGSCVELIDGIKWLIEVVELTQSVRNRIGVEFPSLDNIKGILQEITNAFENSDYVLVGDLLNYELSPIIEDWKNCFELITSKL